MQHELVDRRRWVEHGAFLRGLNYCLLLPGPEAMQLATWLGWRLHGLRGGLAAGSLFVLPSALLLAFLSWLYFRHGDAPAVQGIVLGLQSAVLALLVLAVWRLALRMLGTSATRLLALAALLGSLVAHLPFPLVVAAAGLLGAVSQRWRPGWFAGGPDGMGTAIEREDTAVGAIVLPSPKRALVLALALLAAWWLPIALAAAWLGPDATTTRLGLFFSQAALLTVGGAYAVLPYVAEHAVAGEHWLTASQMAVGLGLAESTPGPLVIVLQFVGFAAGWQQADLASPLASALLGAAITGWATFLPSFLFVLPAAPWIERLHALPSLAAALSATGAALVGVMAGFAAWYGLQVLASTGGERGLFMLSLAALAAGALLRGHGAATVVAGCAALGLLARYALG